MSQMGEADSAASVAVNIARAQQLGDIPATDYQVAHRSFAALLDLRARETPHKVFLDYYNDDTGDHATFTFFQFTRRVNQVARLLSDEYGVKRGDKVAILAFNHPDPIIVCFACWTIGAVAAPQNVSEDDARIAFIFRNAECRIALVNPEYLERTKRLQSQADCLQTVVEMDANFQHRLDALSDEFSPPVTDMRDDRALLVYTSGTTGAPKGVMLSQYNLLVNAQAMAEALGITPDTQMMCVLPVHHVNGLCVTHVTPMFVGCSVVLNRGFKARVFWQRIAEKKVNMVPVVPTLLQFLCEARADLTQLDLSSLQHIICGAGNLSVSLVNRFERQFNKVVLHGYGLSETTAFASMTSRKWSEEARQYWLSGHGYPTIGNPINCNDLAIHDDTGLALPAGEKGEIVIRGHNVMAGYFERDDANLETFKYGWFRSGDEGFFIPDEDGANCYFITGRIKELINRGGVKYSPLEIEEMLLTIPGVKMAVAVAFDNEWYGEEVGAYVVRETNSLLTDADVISACRREMPFAKSPKVVKFGSEIPVTATGKYQRMKLKELFAEYRNTQFKNHRLPDKK